VLLSLGVLLKHFIFLVKRGILLLLLLLSFLYLFSNRVHANMFFHGFIEKKITLWFFGMLCATGMMFVILFGKTSVQAVPGELTVCASGCDYTTIGDAFTAANGNGSITIISVRSGYDPSGDSARTFPRGLTLSCESTDVIIGAGGTPDTLTVVSSSTIQNCGFNNMTIQGGILEQVTISNNVFSTSTFSKLSASLFVSSTISNNSGFQYFAGGLASSTFSGNTIPIHSAANISSYPLDFDPVTSSTISNNTITIYDREISNKTLAFFKNGSTNVTFENNTFAMSTAEQNSDNFTFLKFEGTGTAGTFIIQNNVFSFQDFTQGSIVCHAFIVGGSSSAQVTVSNNTFYWYDDCTGITLSPEAGATVTTTANYNIFYNGSTSTAGTAITFPEYALGTVSLTNNYNGYYQMGTRVSGSGTALDSSYKTSNPFFKRSNIDVSDDWDLAPFSDYLDVFSTTNDIGSKSGSRENTFTIDDDGVVDYSSVHVTSTDIITAARSGDIFSLSAGSYAPATLSANFVTLSGAGASSVIIGTVSTDGFTISGSNNTVSNIVVQNASTTVSSYLMDEFHVSYNGTDYIYDTGSGGRMLLMTNPASCATDQIDGNSFDLTSYMSDPLESFHVAAAQAGGGSSFITLLVPNSIASSGATIETLCSGNGVVVDQFFANVFTPAGSSYTSDPTVITGVSGWTIADGYSSPNITYTGTGYAGLAVSGSSNLISSVTSTGNGYAVSFTGSATGNEISDSVFSSSVLYDVFSSSTGNNSLKNVNFTRTSSSLTYSGTVQVYYKIRGYVTNEDLSAIGGVGVTFVSADESQTATVTTTAGGYTPYTSNLLAFTMSSSSVALTNGGYNPYTITAAATSSYSSTSTSANLSSNNQTASLVMSSAGSAPTAPSDLEILTISTTAIGFRWVDNSNDETAFIVDYISSTDASTFPGTTSTVAANTTSTSITGLTPNAPYMIRIAATNGSGTSSYVTSSARYTTPVAPTKPSATATGSDTVSLSWTANGNATGTVYQIYNVTSDAAYATTTATSTTVSGLSPSTSYVFEIRALWVENSATYSASDDSDAVTTSAASSGGGGGGSGNGNSSGGSSVLPTKPTIPTSGGGGGGSAEAFILNKNIPTTIKRTVPVSITASNVSEMAFSESPNFTGVSFVPFTKETVFTLSPLAGKKTVYLKLRSPQGGEVVLQKQITYVPISANSPKSDVPTACPLPINKPYKIQNSPAVYYILSTNDGCVKRPFRSSQIYFSYFTSWNEVGVVSENLLSTIPNDSVGFMPWGPLLHLQSGSLMKTVDSPDVYLVLSGKRHLIASESVFVDLGYLWSWIDDVDRGVLEKYAEGSIIDTSSPRPELSLIRYPGSSLVYQLQKNDDGELVKRAVLSEASFVGLNYRGDRIMTVDLEETYPDGISL